MTTPDPLRVALEKCIPLLWHDKACDFTNSWSKPCSCGYENVLQAAHAALAGEAGGDGLSKAVEKFLRDIEAIPPWESAGAIWAQRIKELHTAWLDATAPRPAERERGEQ